MSYNSFCMTVLTVSSLSEKAKKFPSTFLGIDLKEASKYFATKFSCGSSVTGEDEIVIQGDVKDELFDILPEKWPEVSLQYHVSSELICHICFINILKLIPFFMERVF